ncbi:Fe-S cluster assembly protein HesB [Candidatus Gottesmanbacteria bacterium]|nr:Fe-S cluster assembly protein HesB [Candidatus Gottesmanbacteria bacterium]
MIFSWWNTHRRDLPWRHTHDPYKILVSEVMLQQTQVLRVLPKYAEFTQAYPTVQELAKASPAQVLRVWKGMGYNRRALYLHKTAQIVVQNYSGGFPIDEKLLTKLPGLGKYTARAVLVFAYKQNISLVDTNIRQIIIHFFYNDKPQKESVIQDSADQLLPKGKAWEWHQALMDFGALRLARARSGQAFGNKDRQRQKPFKDSNRFYRGRIIDRLREGDVHEKVLIRKFSSKYSKTNEFLHSIIESLVRDGLIERVKHETLQLPEK